MNLVKKYNKAKEGEVFASLSVNFTPEFLPARDLVGGIKIVAIKLPNGGWTARYGDERRSKYYIAYHGEWAPEMVVHPFFSTLYDEFIPVAYYLKSAEKYLYNANEYREGFPQLLAIRNSEGEDVFLILPNTYREHAKIDILYWYDDVG